MVDSAGKLFHSIIGINKEVRLSQETLVKKLRKKTITILQALGVGINFLSLGATYVIWNEFYKNKTERIFFETTMCSAIFLLLYSAIPGVINDVEETCLSYTGSPEEKAAIKLSREYQILADSIGKISPESIETFSPHLPPNILSAITPKSSTSSPAPEQSLHTPPPLEEHSTPLHIESKNNSDSSEERPYDEDEKDEYVTVDSNILKTDEMV